jgi:hypothetical protein
MLDSDGNALGEQCLDRTSEWEVAHDLALYDVTTGERQELAGGFGFSLEDGARGYMGNWARGLNPLTYNFLQAQAAST